MATILLNDRLRSYFFVPLRYSHRQQIKTFGVIMFINYPLYYFIWNGFHFVDHTTIVLRVLASTSCLPLILIDHWPQHLERYRLLYWHLAVLYCLPFFFTFMTLHNHGNSLWVMNSVTVLFFLVILFDYWAFFIIAITGPLLGAALYLLLGERFTYIPGLVATQGVLATLGSAVIIGALFSRNRTLIEEEKLRALRTLSFSIAHELRTPLTAIYASMGSVRKHLKGDYIAKHAVICAAVDNALLHTSHLDTITDLLLAKIHPKVDPSAFEICSMTDCVSAALACYPLTEREKGHIHCSLEQNFQFKGEELLVMHVLINLLKNSLYAIREARKGDIMIFFDLWFKR